MRKDAGVLIEVVMLLRDLEDVDLGVGDGEAVTLDVVMVVRDDTEDTVVDFGWRVAELLLEIDRGEDGPLGVLMGLAVGDLVTINMVRDCVGVTLLSEDNVAEVTHLVNGVWYRSNDRRGWRSLIWPYDVYRHRRSRDMGAGRAR